MQVVERDKTKEIKEASKGIGNVVVSVIMAVYNEKTALLSRAVDSILNQTLSELELIIINDGSDEECRSFLHSLKDNRITVLDNESNMGLSASLNRGLKVAKGKYIARMDSDDYSYPDRLRQQVGFMEQHKDIDVLSCIARIVTDGKATGFTGVYRRFVHEDFYILLSIGPMPYPHPTVMFRKSFLDKYDLKYDIDFKRAQDYNMWARCAEKGRFSALGTVLFDYNDVKKQSSKPSALQREYADRTKLYCLQRLLPDCSDRQKELYVHMKDPEVYGTAGENIELLNRLVSANNVKRVYDPVRYKKLLYFWWGRKALYKCNRNSLKEFFADADFRRKAAGAIFSEGFGFVLDRAHEKWFKKTGTKI